MKTILVMTIHRRERLAIKTIQRLSKQTMPLDRIVLVGDSNIERDIACQTGAIYTEHPNIPLGAKWQHGIDFVRSVNPDAIMILGSDDWLSDNWTEVMSKEIEHGYDLVGKNQIYFYNLPDKTLVKWNGYTHPIRKNEPIGAGRLISKRILDKLDWQLFDKQKKRSLDFNSFKRIKEKNGKCKIVYNEDIYVMDIKTDQNITSFIKILKSKRPCVQAGTEIIDNKWVYENFPDMKELENE